MIGEMGILTRNGRHLVSIFAILLVLPSAVLWAQEVKSRTEEIEQARRDKRAHLWPERESPIVTRLNQLVERGLLEGNPTGMGINGWQAVLGGMRSGNGTTFGLGYRRSDLLHDFLDFRFTARGTPQKASMFDFALSFPKLRSERSFVDLYTKHENSPTMDYYGGGPDTEKEDRTSYRLEDTSFNVPLGDG